MTRKRKFFKQEILLVLQLLIFCSSSFIIQLKSTSIYLFTSISNIQNNSLCYRNFHSQVEWNLENTSPISFSPLRHKNDGEIYEKVEIQTILVICKFMKALEIQEYVVLLANSTDFEDKNFVIVFHSKATQSVFFSFTDTSLGKLNIYLFSLLVLTNQEYNIIGTEISAFVCYNSMVKVSTESKVNSEFLLRIRKLRYFCPVKIVTKMKVFGYNPKIATKDARLLEYEAIYNLKDLEAQPITIVRGIISTVLNLTYKFEETEKDQTLHLCDLGFNPIVIKNMKYILFDLLYFNIMYCKSKMDYKSRNIFTVLLIPFDLNTWIAFAIVVLSLMLILRKQRFWYALDMVWNFLGQPCQLSRKKSGAIIFVLFTFLIQQNYLCYLTSDITLPFPHVQINNVNELIDDGYKVIVKHPKHFKLSHYFSLQRFFNKKTNTSVLMKAKGSMDETLANNVDKGAIIIQKRLQNERIMYAESLLKGKGTCHSLSESVIQLNSRIYCKHFYATEYYSVMHQLLAAGIKNRFRRFSDASKHRRWLSKIKKYGKFMLLKVTLSHITPLSQSVLLCTCGICLSIGIFIAEYIINRLLRIKTKVQDIKSQKYRQKTRKLSTKNSFLMYIR